MAPLVGSNSTVQPTVPIRCPVFTHLGYDSDNQVYYCDYESWAYGVFAIVGILLIMVPLVSVICCIAKYRNRRTYVRRLRRTVSSDNTYIASTEQPLIPDKRGHENVLYGTIEHLTPRQSPTYDSERQSQDNISVLSSRASLMPNYDQASLDLKNSKATNLFNNLQNDTDSTDRLSGVIKPEDTVSPYAASNIIPNSSRNNPNSPIYVVPEEASPRISYKDSKDPVYSVLENPNESSKMGDNNQDSSSKEIVSTENQDHYLPANTTTDHPKKDSFGENQNDGETALNLLDTETPKSEPVYNILEPTKANISVENEGDKNSVLDKPAYQSLLSNKETSGEGKSNERTENTEEPRYMPLIFPEEKDNKNSSDNNSSDTPASAESNQAVPPDQQSRERTKSRVDYQELLLDAIKSYPMDERNGCFVLCDSVSAPGCKALTVYHKNPDSEQEFYNFKVCFDEARQVYLAKSAKRFPTIEELLEYLKSNKDMLPCTLRNQIV